MLSLQGVSKWYHGKQKVLDQVSLDLQRGDFIYIVGGSGAGKTSLLRMLATEETPSAGHLSLFGFDLDQVSPSTLSAIRRVVGYVPQDVRLIPDLSVFDNVLISLKTADPKRITQSAKNKIDELLSALSLLDKRNRPASTLSGGEAQRLAVVRALVREPELIVADEPTGAQDRDSTWQMMDLLVKANQKGTTIVLATHDREIVRRVRRQCAVLKQGRLFAEDQLCIY